MGNGYAQEANKIQQELQTYDAIDLKTLDKVKLLNRIDTKYVFHISRFAEILKEVKLNYSALEIKNQRMFAYESLYFDTDDYQLYRFHHSGKFNRLKVRYRKYTDSGMIYFEVKYKAKGNRTDKKRLKVQAIQPVLNEQELALVHHSQLNKEELKPKMWIYFNRITLAAKAMNERLTLDLNIAFDNLSEKKFFPELVIAEVKTEKNATGSSIVKSFNKRHFEEVGFSKYATAVALMEKIKSNAFKPNLIKIEKILQHGNYRND